MSSGAVERLERIERLLRLADALIWGWLAGACLIGSILFFLDPESLERSPVGRTLHPLDYIWNAGFGASGALLLWGLVRNRVDVEVLGLMIFAWALTVYTIALVTIGDKLLGTLTYPALAAATVVRTWARVLLMRYLAEGKRE